MNFVCPGCSAVDFQYDPHTDEIACLVCHWAGDAKPFKVERRANDPVNNPSHYNSGKIEVIDFIDDQNLGFYEGNVVKYVSRALHKGKRLEDLKKAQWYLNRLVTILEMGLNRLG